MSKKKPTAQAKQEVGRTGVKTSTESSFIIFDQVGDRFFPRCHAPFQLDSEAFRQKQLPELPSAKDKIETLQWAEDTGEGLSEYEKLKQDAAKAKRLEQKGGLTQEERDDAISKIRFGIDEFLLCRKKNPSAVADLTEMLDYGMIQLYSAVQKEQNKAAAIQLTTLLAKHVEMLRDLVLENPKMFEGFAHKHPRFPVPGSRFKDEQLKNERLLNEILVVGRDYWDQQRRKQRYTKESGPAKEIARKLIDYLSQYRMGYNPYADDLPQWTKRLPKLKQISQGENWRDWFQLAWEVVLETTERKPCRVAAYRLIAKRSHRKSYRQDGKCTHVANLNSGIRDALSEAISELAKGISPRTEQRNKRGE